MISVSSAPDPFVCADAGGYKNTVGKTLVSSVISAPLTTKTVILGGQSNHQTSCGTTTYTTISSQAQNLNIYDGGIYAGSDPVLGTPYFPSTGVSSVNMRLMDRLISTGKATRAIAVPIAVGGVSWASWEPLNNINFTRIVTAILRCRARGLEPDAFLWADGETDNNLGTTAAAIQASVWNVVDGIRAMGCTSPFYVGKFTWNGTAVSSAVQTGLANAVDVGRNIKAGYDADTNLTVAGGFRLADNLHLSNTGLDALAIGWQTVAFP